MPSEQISIRMDSRLLEEIDRIAHEKYKNRSDIIRDALVEYVEGELEEEEIKELVTRKFLEGKLEYRDFAKVVGIEKAKEIETAKEVLEESIESAKEE
ncbi:MAG: ribbon-helix-helix domain-containing protein [Candidatus Natronoplasma sp.]